MLTVLLAPDYAKKNPKQHGHTQSRFYYEWLHKLLRLCELGEETMLVGWLVGWCVGWLVGWLVGQ
jgi:hypothetical protein